MSNVEKYIVKNIVICNVNAEYLESWKPLYLPTWI
jgi:hypothetical protein